MNTILFGIIVAASAISIIIFSISTHYFITILEGVNKKRHINLKGILKLLNKPINTYIDKAGDKISETLSAVETYGKVFFSIILILSIISFICGIIGLI